MKKMLRKILAVLVVFSVVLSVGIIAMQGGTLADNGIYYQNDFSGALDEGNWSNASKMSVSDGTLKITAKTYLTLASTKNLSNYVVEAKVSMDDTNRTVKAPTAGIVMYTDSSNNGYELTLLRSYSEKTGGRLNGSYVRLYDRIANTGVSANTDMMYDQIENNVQYTLKMVIIDNKIDCYVDGTLVKSYDNLYTGGGVGLNANSCVATIDDLIVRKPTAAEGGEVSSNVTSTPDSSAPAGSSEVSSTVTSNPTSSEASSTVTSAGSTSSGSGSNAYFEDNFNSGAITGWNKTGTVADGKYVVSSANWADAAALLTYGDYTVEAEVALDPSSESATSTANEMVAGITGRVSNKAKNAYELTMGYARSKAISQAPDIGVGELFLRLYRRGDSDNSAYLGYVSVADVLGVSSVAKDSKHTIKMVFVGSTVKCFVDGKLAMVVTDTVHTAGTVGVRASSITANMDNYVMRPSTQAEIDAALSGSNTSSGSTSSGSTSSGSTSSGSTSSGSTSSGSTPGAYFEDNFNNNKTTGWEKSGTVVNGKYKVTTQNWAKDTNLLTYSDYTVEAEVTLDPTSVSGTANEICTGISGRSSSRAANAYELTIGYIRENTLSRAPGIEVEELFLRLYRRGNNDNSAYLGYVSVADVLGVDYVELDSTHTIKMAFIGSTIKCFIDDKLAMEITDTVHTAGTVGVRFATIHAYVDNFVMRPTTQAEKDAKVVDNSVPPVMPEADKNGVYYATDFEDISVIQDTNWSTPIANMQDGMAVLSTKLGTKSNTIGNPNFTLLKDYVVQADVVIDPESVASISNPVFSVIGRIGSNGNGYELGLLSNTTGTTHKLRLYDRNNSATVAEVEVTAERGKAYTLRLVMIGDIIRGYFGEEKVIEVKNTTFTAGTAGYKINGIDGFLQNYIIRKPTAAEIKGEGGAIVGGNGSTPNTGDRTLYTVFGVIAVLVLCAAVLLVLTRRKKQN